MAGYAVIAPEIVVLATALVALFGDLLACGREKASAWIGAGGALAALACSVAVGTGRVPLFGDAFLVDGTALFVRTATLGLAALYLLWLAGRGVNGSGSTRVATGLVLFSTLGCLLMAGARDYVVLLLSLECATMPAYVLIGFDRKDDRALEGALKYFLLSMVTSVVMFYGISLVLGLTGSTAIAPRALAGSGMAGALASVLVMVGLLAKLSAAPFHFWSPDAYAGAPVFSVAFVSAIPKVAGIAALVNVAATLGGGSDDVALVLPWVAAFSMLLGNLSAFPQKDLRRLMAYSGVAHAGYLLMGVAAGTPAGRSAAVLYALMYAVPSMGVMMVAADGGTTMDRIAGLAKRRPGAAWAMVVFLASLVGVPPLAGFFGKLYLFGTSLDAGQTWLVVLAVLTSAMSAGYYLRIVRAAFFEEGSAVVEHDAGRSVVADVALWITVAVTAAVGLASGPLLELLRLRFS